MRFHLEDRHKEHIRRLGHEPPDHIDAEQTQYFAARDRWTRTLERTFGKVDEDLLHEKAVGHLVSRSEAAKKQLLLPEQPLKKWRALLWVALGLLIFAAGHAHCQFSYPIQTKNGGSNIGFHKSFFAINCSTGMTCTDNGSTFTLTATGGAPVGYQTLQNAAVSIAQETTLNWTAGITCVDNAGAARSDCALATVTATAHKFFNAVTSGALVAAQPDFSDLTGTATSSQVPHNLLSAFHSDTTAASAVRGDGIFAIGATPTWQRLAHSSATGGYFKWNGTDIVASTGAAAGTGACSAHQWVSTDNADAAPTCTQPAFSDISGTATSGQLPATIVYNNQANTYSGGGLQDLSAMKFKPPTSTVASLPAASSNTSVVYEVTDGATASDCTSGGGSTRVWCVSNGSVWTAIGDGGSGGGVTSIATTSPIQGGTITTTGTISCPTCVVATVNPGAGVGHFAGSTQTITSSAVAQGDVTNGYVDLSSNQTVNGNKTIAGNTTIAGGQNTITTYNLDNVLFVDGAKYAQTAAGINSALTDAGSTKEVWVPSTATSLSDTTISLQSGSVLKFLGSQTFTVAGIIGPDSSIDTTATWVIDCPSHATLKLANLANRDVITDTNFLTLSGSGNTFGTFGATIRGCTIDGNKANQTALATRGTGTPSTVARTAGGVVTIVMTGATSPAMAVGDTCNVQGITNDTSSFDGRFIAQSGTTASQLVFNQTARNTVTSTAATGSGTVVCYSGANGVRLFGRHWDIEDVSIGNNVLDGLWTEGYTPSFVDLTSRLESTARRIRLTNSGGDGWVHWGPQNSFGYDVIDFNHGQWGREIFEPLRDFGTVGYLNTSGSLHIQGMGSVQQSAAQETSASGWGILVDSGTQANTHSSTLASCTGCIAYEVRSPNQVYHGALQNSGTAIKVNGGSGLFDINAYSNSGTLVTLTSENGVSAFILQGDTTSNTACFSTTPNQNDFVTARTSGGTACNTFDIPGSTISSQGWTQTMPTGANSTFAVLGLAQTFTQKQTFAGSGTTGAAINIASQTAPTTPANGDIWTDTSEEKHVVTTATAGAVKIYDSGGSNSITDTVNGTITTHTVNRALAAASGVLTSVNSSGTMQWNYSGDSAHSISKTAQTAAITTATLCAATANTACGQAGTYRVSWSFYGSGTACSSVTAGSVTFLLTWTDPNGTVHSAVALPMVVQNGASTTTTQASFPFQTALANESASGDYTFSTNGAVIQYATGYTACTTGTGTYNLKATVFQIQ